MDIDLSSWPLLRLDQLQICPLDLLKRALTEVGALLSSIELSQDGGVNLGAYARRELLAIDREIKSRAASERVSKMIHGTLGLPQSLDNLDSQPARTTDVRTKARQSVGGDIADKVKAVLSGKSIPQSRTYVQPSRHVPVSPQVQPKPFSRPQKSLVRPSGPELPPKAMDSAEFESGWRKQVSSGVVKQQRADARPVERRAQSAHGAVQPREEPDDGRKFRKKRPRRKASLKRSVTVNFGGEFVIQGTRNKRAWEGSKAVAPEPAIKADSRNLGNSYMQHSKAVRRKQTPRAPLSSRSEVTPRRSPPPSVSASPAQKRVTATPPPSPPPEPPPSPERDRRVVRIDKEIQSLDRAMPARRRARAEPVTAEISEEREVLNAVVEAARLGGATLLHRAGTVRQGAASRPSVQLELGMRGDEAKQLLPPASPISFARDSVDILVRSATQESDALECSSLSDDSPPAQQPVGSPLIGIKQPSPPPSRDDVSPPAQQPVGSPLIGIKQPSPPPSRDGVSESESPSDNDSALPELMSPVSMLFQQQQSKRCDSPEPEPVSTPCDSAPEEYKASPRQREMSSPLLGENSSDSSGEDDASSEEDDASLLVLKERDARSSPDAVRPPSEGPPKEAPPKAKGRIAKLLPAKLLSASPVDYSEFFPSFRHIFSCSWSDTGTPLSTTVVRDSELMALRGLMQQYSNFVEVMEDMDDFEGVDLPATRPPMASMHPLSWLKLNSKSGKTGPSPRKRYFRVLQNRPEVYDIVKQGIEAMPAEEAVQWVELPNDVGGTSPCWNLLWTWSRPKIDFSTLLTWQRVNHFQMARQLTRKDMLKKNFDRYLRTGGRLSQMFDIMPDTYVLPGEYLQFVEAFSKAETPPPSLPEGAPYSNLWIMKPVGLSRGRGIRLVDSISNVCYGESVVIQRYVHNPMLLDGYKFDLRIYVLVTSFQPLEAFLYEDGFARLATEKYTLADSKIQERMVHLTNSSVQKFGEESDFHAAKVSNSAVCSASEDDSGGTKLSLAYLWRRLESSGIDVARLKERIEALIVKSLVCVDDVVPFSVSAGARIPNLAQPNSFEVFGYDVLIDSDFTPWLIEINASPAMSVENPLDKKVKGAMVRDSIALVNPLAFDRGRLCDVLRHRTTRLANSASKPYAGHSISSGEVERDLLNHYLTYLLHGELPRRIGEAPKYVGGYKKIAPGTKVYDKVMKVKRACIRKHRPK